MNITWFPGLDPLPQHTRAQQAGGMGSVVAGSLAATDKIDLLGLGYGTKVVNILAMLSREIARFSFCWCLSCTSFNFRT